MPQVMYYIMQVIIILIIIIELAFRKFMRSFLPKKATVIHGKKS